MMHASVRALLDQITPPGALLTAIVDDSRQVTPGALFLAMPGGQVDGRCYIGDAIARGAAAVLWEEGGEFSWNPQWTVRNQAVRGLRDLAGPLAHAFHAFPSEHLSLIAVTGTNGKTTISQMLGQLYPKPCAVIGTLGAGFPDTLQETGFTTPEACFLMAKLAEFQIAGAAACALEASSIGIEEGRMNGVRVDVAIFTNLTRDHLDYHGDMAAYAAAKAKLFQWPRLRTAIINVNDPFGRQLLRETTANRVLGYGIGPMDRAYPALVRAEHLVQSPFGQCFELVLPNGRAQVETALLGHFNVSNLLAVAAVLHDCGLPAHQIALALAKVKAPAGRLQPVTLSVPGASEERLPMVLVDYAHTPDALASVLRALRPLAGQRAGKLRVIFGCGGDRDAGKRPEMGRIAEAEADVVCVTSDNPRNEAAAAIITQIVAGMQLPAQAIVCVDRGAAIAQVIAEAAPQDVILIAGKGHENYQLLGNQRLDFSDRDEAEQALVRRLGEAA